MMKRQGIRLLERRVKLYDKRMEVLVKTWDMARGLHGGGGELSDYEAEQTVQVLAEVALWTLTYRIA